MKIKKEKVRKMGANDRERGGGREKRMMRGKEGEKELSDEKNKEGKWDIIKGAKAPFINRIWRKSHPLSPVFRSTGKRPRCCSDQTEYSEW